LKNDIWILRNKLNGLMQRLILLKEYRCPSDCMAMNVLMLEDNYCHIWNRLQCIENLFGLMIHVDNNIHHIENTINTLIRHSDELDEHFVSFGSNQI